MMKARQGVLLMVIISVWLIVSYFLLSFFYIQPKLAVNSGVKLFLWSLAGVIASILYYTKGWDEFVWVTPLYLSWGWLLSLPLIRYIAQQQLHQPWWGQGVFHIVVSLGIVFLGYVLLRIKEN